MSDKEIAARLKLDTGDASRSMGSFKKELREAQQDLLSTAAKFGETSKQAQAAAKRVAELRDTIGDANSLVAAFNPDRKFVAFGQAVQGVVGGFSALQGVMGLIGVESENVQKQLLKVQSALALTQGLDSVRESVQGFKNMAAVISNQVVKAFSTLKGAIISTGIGALVVALGVLIANFDKISDAISGIDEKTKNLAENSKKAAESEQKKLDAISEQDNILRLQGKTEKDILNLKIAQTDEVIAARQQQLIAQQELAKGQLEAAKRNHAILKGILDFITKPIDTVLKRVAKVTDFLGLTKNASESIAKSIEVAHEKITNFFFDPEEVKQEGEAAQEELRKQIDALKNARAGFQLQIRDINKKGAGKPEEFKNKLTKDEEEQSLEERFPELKSLEEASSIKIKLIDQELMKDAERTATEKANAEARAAYAQWEAEGKVSAARAVGNALGALSELIGKQTAAGKALGIAQATINTWIGVSEVLRSKSLLPEPAATISKIANVVAIVATGLTAVKNIVKTQVPGGGGGSGGGGSITPPSPITPPAPQNTSTTLDQNALNNQGNAAVRAFVLESDVTNNQEKIKRLSRAARLGG
jgi:hypothetical protein